MKDEEGSLPLLACEMDGLAALLSERGDALEVILVDDGSADGTGTACAAWCAGAPRRRMLRHEVNRGFGAGLRTGVAATSGEAVVSYDADCAYPARDVVKLLDALRDGADVASATPFGAGGEFRESGLRALLSRACSALYRVALRGRAKGVRTFTCAFRAYRGDLVRGLTWKADRFLAAAEILSLALLRGARVVEVPSSLRPRVAGVSKMRVVRTALGHLGLVARLAVTPGAA
jgi:dolichol-phosphate mannosyltransferase